MFAPDFGARKMAREMEILEMPERALVTAWEACVRRALEAKVAVEEEVAKAQSAQVRPVSHRLGSLGLSLILPSVSRDGPRQRAVALRRGGCKKLN